MYFECIRCSQRYEWTWPIYRCGCGGNLWLELDFDAPAAGWLWPRCVEVARSGIFAFGDLLMPGLEGSPFRQVVGPSPLLEMGDVAREMGLGGVWFKDDTRLPSCSFKDRGSSLVIAATGRGMPITTASTGNAGCSLACLSADAGLDATVFVPWGAPVAKVQQLQMYGARVVRVKGSYDDAFDLSFAVSREMGWVNRSTGWNPLTREGKKSCSLEIVWQMEMAVPDIVFVSTGDGNILSGIYKGFYDLAKAGLTTKLPRVVAVQSSGSRAIADAFERYQGGQSLEESVVGVTASTLADSISVGYPRDADGALRALSESDGWVEVVSDTEILESIRVLAGRWGLFVEPAAAAAHAGLVGARRRGAIGGGEKVVVLLSGNGLKDPGAAVAGLAPTLEVEADVEAALALFTS